MSRAYRPWPLVSLCPQCHGHRPVCLTIPVDDPGGIYRDKARVSLAARRAIDKDVARNDADGPWFRCVVAYIA